ncbi:hypothetical protein [Streptacidiphilus melanogenes]|uniref:hypothetical protein n=1 Tax=Streptacidiphilus melanogenes TaxID=411235 RepID=UPI0006940834|nr:hypothetical protein [Streptacidiphilus melanogenes]
MGGRFAWPAAFVAAFCVFVGGVWAVATTSWSTVAAEAAAPTATPTTTAPAPAPSSSATPALWTQSTLRTYLVAELNRTDPGVALDDLEHITRVQPQVSRFCHPVAHDLGHAALKKYGSFGKAVAFRNDVCGSGYLHGVVEETLAQSPDPVAAVTTLCAPQMSASCIHGIGHGAMFVSRLNVPKAERLCDRFGQTYQVVACSEGVFMQLFEPDEDDPAALVQLPSARLAAEPLYPCPEQPSIFQSACYFYAPIYYLQTHDYVNHPESFVQALRWCLKAPTSAGQQSCTRGTGSRLIKYNIDRPVWTAAQCEAAPREWQRPACVGGMVSYWNVNFHDKSARTKLCPQLSGEAAVECRASSGGSSSED